MKFKRVHLVRGALMCEVGRCGRRKRGLMEASERYVILLCEACEEWTVLGGPLLVWRSESTTFGCRCGEQLTLANRIDSGEVNMSATTTAAKPLTSLPYL